MVCFPSFGYLLLARLPRASRRGGFFSTSKGRLFVEDLETIGVCKVDRFERIRPSWTLITEGKGRSRRSWFCVAFCALITYGFVSWVRT